MPFRKYARAFGPDDIRAMGHALEIAWAHLNADSTTLKDNDAATERLAALIVEVAETGERNPDKLAASALEKFLH